MARRIAIVGGGVIGASVAWHLAAAEAGEIVLVERATLGAGSTWHSAGNITWSARNDGPVLATLEAAETVAREADQATGWLRTGRLFLARKPETLDDFTDSMRIAEQRGYGSRLLSPAEAARHHPLLDPGAIAGAWLNGLSGRLNPADLTAAYARAARRRGVVLREGCAVTGLVTRRGRIAGFDTADGRIDADVVVVAAGLWSRRFLAGAGVALAQWGCEHFYLIARPEPALGPATPSFVSPEDSIYGREEVGGMLYGFFDADAKTLDAGDGAPPDNFTFSLLDEDWDKIAPYAERAMQLFPALEHAPVTRFVNGPEAFTPDGEPLVGPVGGIDGLFVASAMNSAGVTLSGLAGRLIADAVTGAKPRLDPAPYAADRFGERASDEAWLRAAVTQTPSSHYRFSQT